MSKFRIKVGQEIDIKIVRMFFDSQSVPIFFKPIFKRGTFKCKKAAIVEVNISPFKQSKIL